MADLWYDPKRPALVQIGRKPQPPRLSELAPAAALLLLGGLMNVLFFVILQ